MTFEVIRVVAIMVEIGMESSLSDFDVVFYDASDKDHVIVINWEKIPDRFNCKVNNFSFDFETKRIYIKSEVVNHE